MDPSALKNVELLDRKLIGLVVRSSSIIVGANLTLGTIEATSNHTRLGTRDDLEPSDIPIRPAPRL